VVWIHLKASLTREFTPAIIRTYRTKGRLDAKNKNPSQPRVFSLRHVPGKSLSAHSSPHDTNPTSKSSSGNSPGMMIGLPLSYELRVLGGGNKQCSKINERVSPSVQVGWNESHVSTQPQTTILENAKHKTRTMRLVRCSLLPWYTSYSDRCDHCRSSSGPTNPRM
jgi:hypothetical protein